VLVEWTRLGTCLGYYTGKGLAWKWSEPLGRGDRVGVGQRTETSCERVPGLHWGRMCEGDRTSRGGQSVPKRRHIKFRRRGITQKKAYNIQYKAKVWNQNFFYISSLKTLFSKRTFIELKMCVYISCIYFFFLNISHSKKNWVVYYKKWIYWASYKVTVIVWF